MKIISWNVNSIRTRLERLQGVLRRHSPDVVCLQETKVPDHEFPSDALAELGYHCTVFGQGGGYNGVALLTRETPTDVQQGFDGNPAPEQARVISGVVAGVKVVGVYVVNGQSVDSEKYQLKLDWLDTLQRWIARFHRPDQPLLVAGDFNIAPDERDIHNPKLWRGKVLCSDAERERLQAMVDWGLADLLRVNNAEAGVYSWWDYRYGAFNRNLGLRIDLILGSQPMVQRLQSVVVDRDERGPKAGPGKPSDHAPVIATFVD